MNHHYVTVDKLIYNINKLLNYTGLLGVLNLKERIVEGTQAFTIYYFLTINQYLSETIDTYHFPNSKTLKLLQTFLSTKSIKTLINDYNFH